MNRIKVTISRVEDSSDRSEVLEVVEVDVSEAYKGRRDPQYLMASAVIEVLQQSGMRVWS